MGHTYCQRLIHVIFSTKERRPSILETFRHRLYEYMGGVARQEFGRAVKIGGTENHVHGLLSMRTDVSVAEAMRKWKSLSSGWIHKAIPGSERFGWQTGYGAFSVSQSNAVQVLKYIENQADHHKRVTFEEEFIALLKRHRVDYDAAHVWD